MSESTKAAKRRLGHEGGAGDPLADFTSPDRDFSSNLLLPHTWGAVPKGLLASEGGLLSLWGPAESACLWDLVSASGYQHASLASVSLPSFACDGCSVSEYV